MNAAVALLPICVSQWLFVWALRFLPNPIKNQWIRSATALILGLIMSVIDLALLFVYRHVTGFRGNLGHDPVFMTAFLGTNFVSICIGFHSAAALKQKRAS